MYIEIGARVHTRDGSDVGEVHRVIVDLEQQALTSIVVLKGRFLSRDILVPIDFVERADQDSVKLSLDKDGLDQLPDFAYNEILTPPPTWAFPLPYPGGAVYVPVSQRERLGGQQVDITPGTHVHATDGNIGTVDRVEFDAQTDRIDAFWVKAGTIFSHDLRIPVEWVTRADESGLQLSATRDQIESRLGAESRSRVRP
jgi:uncharacterized protein YrrD